VRRLIAYVLNLVVLSVAAAPFALVAVPAAEADQTIAWVSVSADGTVNGGFGRIAVSDDGRYVAFRSSANLVPGDTAHYDVYVKDMQTGALELVSVSSGGVKGNKDSGTSIDISDDGRYVVFSSPADNLVADDTNALPDVFIRDRTAGTTERVLGTDGSQGGQAFDAAISGNGRYVAFAGSDYEPAPAGSPSGTFVYDRVAGTSERITDGVVFLDSASQANTDISDDGRFVAFTTAEFGLNNDVILFDRQTDTYEIANPRIGGARPQSAHPEDIEVSGNGQFVTFGSPDTNYVAGDTADTNDVFVYDAATDTLERIGGAGTTVSEDPLPVISDDGRYVAFTSTLDTYGAGNPYSDMILYDRDTDTGTVVSIYNDGSPGTTLSGNHLTEPAISGDGRFVAFTTAEGFDPGDTSGYDVYEVDVEGMTTGECTHGFTDVDSANIFESDICWLAAEGITLGCNPPTNDEFCPDDNVTRGQMAAFLVRALGYTDNGGGDLFTDDDGSVFEGDIDRLGTAGVTRGCNPPTNDEFCPDENVTREQMAAFLRRALDN
jgi:Tol biopolymer transport system component